MDQSTELALLFWTFLNLFPFQNKFSIVQYDIISDVSDDVIAQKGNKILAWLYNIASHTPTHTHHLPQGEGGGMCVCAMIATRIDHVP